MHVSEFIKVGIDLRDYINVLPMNNETEVIWDVVMNNLCMTTNLSICQHQTFLFKSLIK